MDGAASQYSDSYDVIVLGAGLAGLSAPVAVGAPAALGPGGFFRLLR